ncbi:uncharacterized protein LOC143852478 [Tasmannia lanceolata]|uniref:uncharacterized protein LOC143852478 n=1 Tax=Tasmannia lanceolata TaxID=3420 RepID=UPI004063EC42
MEPLKYLFEKPAHIGRTTRWLLLLSEFDVTQKSIKGRIIAVQLADSPVEDIALLKAEFSDEEIMDIEEETPSTKWLIYFDGAVNNQGQGVGAVLFKCTNNIAEYEACITGLEAALALHVQDVDVFGDSILMIFQTNGRWRTREDRLTPYNTYLESLVKKFINNTFTHLSRIGNHFADALATLASMLDISTTMEVQPLAVKLQWAPAHVNAIEISARCPDGKPWYTDIKNLILGKGHPSEALGKEHRTLQRLASNFIICGEELYRRSFDSIQLSCVDVDQAAELIEETHEGVCGPHMNGKMLSRKILRLGFYWQTMEADCFAFVKKCHKRQVYANLIHIEAASYAFLTSASVAKFICTNIICRYRVPHELILDNGSHFKKKVVHLCEEFKIKHHKSSHYKPQTNGAVKAVNKNIKGMEAVLRLELRIPSLRVMMEANLPVSGAKARYHELHMIDEKRLKALYHIQGYQRRIERAFNKNVCVRDLK